MKRVYLRILFDAAAVAACLSVSAGTVHWWQAWVLVGVLLLVRLDSARVVSRVNAALLEQRSGLPIHSSQPWYDRVLVLAVLGLGFLGVPLVCGVDTHHLRSLPQPMTALRWVGLASFVIGWLIKRAALWANAFATTELRIQAGGGHVAIDSGPYRFVRHPFYAADPLIFVGESLWLGSYLGVLYSIVPLLLVVTRLCFEDALLRRELSGYTDYASRVPYRLVPRVW
jgi:protein-S-isoprenylcysteine O-methyltransferase Ste14